MDNPFDQFVEEDAQANPFDQFVDEDDHEEQSTGIFEQIQSWGREMGEKQAMIDEQDADRLAKIEAIGERTPIGPQPSYLKDPEPINQESVDSAKAQYGSNYERAFTGKYSQGGHPVMSGDEVSDMADEAIDRMDAPAKQRFDESVVDDGFTGGVRTELMDQFAVNNMRAMNPVQRSAVAFVDRAADSILLGQGDKVESFAARMRGEDPDAARDSHNARERGVRSEAPIASLTGEMAGYVVPGTAGFKAANAALKIGARVAVPSGVRAAFTPKGTSLFAQAIRYGGGVIAPASVAGALDYSAYEAFIGTSNRAADENRVPMEGERFDAFGNGMKDPMAYAFGAALSPIYRVGHFLVGTAGNTGKKLLGKEADGWFGNLTPRARREYAAAITDPVNRAYADVSRLLTKDGVTPEMLKESLKNYNYAGYNSVEEMLFELADVAAGEGGAAHIRNLAVALGTVKGKAQGVAREAFKARNASSPSRIRETMRKVMGIEGDGDSFTQFKAALETAQNTKPKPFYDEAYAKEISDDEWAGKVWPGLSTSHSARKAIDDAVNLALDRNELGVARELDAIRQGLPKSALEPGSAGAVPKKPSTQALDYIDRQLGDISKDMRATSRGSSAAGVEQAQTGLRGVLDPATGLNQGRDVSREFIVARKALDDAFKAAKNQTPLHEVQQLFAKEIDELGGENIEGAILMGWMRGVEAMIEKATNPGSLIRQMYGSEQQRQKLAEMARKATIGASSKATGTKRQRAVLGDPKKGRPGLFEREGTMFESQRLIVEGSQTAQRTEAVAAQGGLERAAHVLKDALLNPGRVADDAVGYVINRATRGGIFDDGVNAAMGDILFKGGAANLKKIIKNLEEFQTGKKTQKPATAKPTYRTGQGDDEVVKAAGFLPTDVTRAAWNKPGTSGAVMGGAAGYYGAPEGSTMEERLAYTAAGAIGGSAGMKGARKIVDKTVKFKPGEVPLYDDWHKQAYGVFPDSRRYNKRNSRAENKRRRAVFNSKKPTKTQIREHEADQRLEDGWRQTDSGVWTRRSDSSDYDIENPMFRHVDFEKLNQAGIPFDEGLDALPGLALPSKASRAVTPVSSARNEWVWLADSAENAERLAGLSDKARKGRVALDPTKARKPASLALVVPKGTASEVRLKRASDPAAVERRLNEEFAKGASRVRVTVPEQTIQGNIVPEYSVWVARKGDLRSPKAKFDPKKRGQKGVMNGAGSARTAAGGSIQGAVVGGVHPDLNGDGEVTLEERLKGVIGGAVIGAVAGKHSVAQSNRVHTSGFAGRKRLPMDEASRMTRAKEMGFDTDVALYHGTEGDVAAFDKSKFGSGIGGNSAKEGVWLSSSPQTANGYAEVAHYKPYSDKVDALIEASNAAERAQKWDKASDLMRQAEALEAQHVDEVGGAVIPTYVRGKLKTIDMDGEMYTSRGDFSLTEQIEDAKNAGFDGIKFTNFSDEAHFGKYNSTDHVVVFDPKNIRSKFAKFDPADADSPVLSNGAPGTLSGVFGGATMVSVGSSMPREDGSESAAFPEREIDKIMNHSPRATYDFASGDEVTAARQEGANQFLEASKRRRAQLDTPIELPQNDPELMGGAEPDSVRWQEMAQGLREAVDAGDMTLAEATAQLDRHLARSGQPRSLNVFRYKQRTAA